MVFFIFAYAFASIVIYKIYDVQCVYTKYAKHNILCICMCHKNRDLGKNMIYYLLFTSPKTLTIWKQVPCVVDLKCLSANVFSIQKMFMSTVFYFRDFGLICIHFKLTTNTECLSTIVTKRVFGCNENLNDCCWCFI